MAQLGHRIAACRDAQNVMHQSFDELLGDIFAGEIPLREFSCRQELIEGNGLGGKRNRLVLTKGHAEGTPWLAVELRNIKQLYWTPPNPSSGQKEQSL